MVELRPQHQNNFNFLRLLFALMVVLSHSPELADGDRRREIFTVVFGTMSMGEFAVDGFFLLSGYLIVQSWESDPNVFAFLRKRVLRIFPAFVVATFFCIFVIAPLAATPGGFVRDPDLSRVILDAALLQKPHAPYAFSGTHHPSLNGSMWTISREFLCYLSVLAIGIVGGIKHRAVWLAFAVLLLGFVIGQRLGIFRSYVDPFWGLACYFFAGGTFYLYRDKISYSPRLAIAAGLFLLVAMFSWRLSAIAVSMVGGYLLCFIAFRRFKLLENFGKLPDVSYGVYLYAWPLQKLMYWYMPTVSPWLVFAITSVGSLILGAVSWYAVEKPFLSFKRVDRRSAAATS